MIRTIALTRFHQIRIWVDELPSIPATPVSRLEAVLPATNTISLGRRTSAIESRRIVGPRSVYGLLCASCEPAGSEACTQLVVMERNSLDGVQLSWAIGADSDLVTAGIPHEFVEAIIEGASNPPDIHNIGGTTITFVGASATLGSSKSVFFHLADALVRLILQRDWPPPDWERLVRERLCPS